MSMCTPLCAAAVLLSAMAFAGAEEPSKPAAETATAAAASPAFKETPQSMEARSAALQLVREALVKWSGQDARGALELFNKAVGTAPNDPLILWMRGDFFRSAAERTRDTPEGKDLAERLKKAAANDYHAAVAAAPDSMAAADSLDSLEALRGRDLFPETPLLCPPEDVDAVRRAQRLVAEQKYEEAKALFRDAADRCPNSAPLWVSFGDAFFAAGDFAMAKTIFARAVEADPWNRQAARFLADAERKLGNADEALRADALAVLGNPTLEHAWARLRDDASAAGRDCLRRRARLPEVKKSAAQNGGKATVSIGLPFAMGNAGEEGDGALFFAYALGMGSAVADADKAASGETTKVGTPATPLEIKRANVLFVLKAMNAKPKANAPFWSLMQRAEKAGYLDEAIFLHMLGEDLVPEYKAFRERSRDRLMAYLLTVVVPARSAPAAAKP